MHPLKLKNRFPLGVVERTIFMRLFGIHVLLAYFKHYFTAIYMQFSIVIFVVVNSPRCLPRERLKRKIAIRSI